MTLKKIVRSLVPVGLLDLRRGYLEMVERRHEDGRHKTFARLNGTVSDTIKSIRSLTPAQRSDVEFLERKFIPSLGLNDELLHQQPSELSDYFGRGLHIWQYPNQLARYLAWLSTNANGVKTYMEIGCRWGGMFILITEWLRKNGANIETVVAIDPIKPTPFIQEYFEFLKTDEFASVTKVKPIYVREFSTSEKVRKLVSEIKPDFVFIDGDHGIHAVLSDHMLVRDNANIIVHHDINSQACPDVSIVWSALKRLEGEFDFFDFIDQYKSVEGNFLGIGVMKRRSRVIN
jgi:cephalosporin hydroxylase